jgi:hypothetical protein
MPKVGSNRLKRQDRRERKNNLMSGPGRRAESREWAEEKTRRSKVERFKANLS